MISKPFSCGRRYHVLGYLAVVLLFVGAAASSVEAGNVIELKTVYFDGSKPDEKTTIYVDEGRLRFDAMENGKQMILIITLDEAGDPICRVIDPNEKSYTEITRESSDKVKAQIKEGKKQMEEQLKQLPAEQQQHMRQMMEKQLGQFEKVVNIEFKQIATGVDIKKWSCVQYESLLDGDKHEDIWTADWKQIGLKKSDAAIFKQFGSLFVGISPETNAFFHTGGSASDGGFDGFPVMVVEYKDGVKYEKSEVTAISEKKLEDELFALPKGLTKVSLFER
ncbi:MAG: DUF4412 domain-containing protein [Candidatus Latescibacterota bacterium]|nr:MAG: DUF4412 domain-containing protein [Candidatus Latescibacterota bacterium]